MLAADRPISTGRGRPDRECPAGSVPADILVTRAGCSRPSRRDPGTPGTPRSTRASRPSPMRLRVISTRPSSEMSKICERVLSRASALRNASTTLARFSRISMSMKSITMMPPMSRRRSCLAISSAASMLLWNTVASRFDVPTFLPVFTSITVSASVCSMISEPPDGSHTLRSSALCTCSCTWCFSNSDRSQRRRDRSTRCDRRDRG